MAMTANTFDIDTTISREEAASFLEAPHTSIRDSLDWVEEALGLDTTGMPMEGFLSVSDDMWPNEAPQEFSSVDSPSSCVESLTPQFNLLQFNAAAFAPLKASNAEKMLVQVESVARIVHENMKKLLEAQKGVPLPIDQASFLKLQGFQQTIQSDVETIHKELNQLLDTTILSPKEFNTLHQLILENGLARRQLEVFKDELNGFVNQNAVPSFALAIVSQPFPESVKQNTKVDDSLTVKILCGAKNTYRPQCRVKGEILMNATSPKKSAKNQPPILVENVDKPVNDSGVAHFDNIRFPNGTRLKGIRLKFFANMTLPDKNGVMHPVTLESPASGAVVVKTNENQWGEAEGVLIKKTAFEGKNEIHWYRLANWLQRRYILATRQNLSQPTRPLTSHDFKYIHKNKFANKLVVSQSQFDQFWAWFGPILHKIRHQRYLCPLWLKGYICGFLARQEVESVLQNERIGTFLIRFSENHESFVISYQAVDGGGTRVKHYLLKQDDTMGAKKTLADFLREFRDLVVILQMRTEKDLEQRTLTRCDKDIALKEFYTRYKSQKTGVDGYEEEMQVRGEDEM